MGDTVITVTVTGGGGLGSGTLGDEIALESRMRVKHNQGACLPCRLNNDPMNIPCKECTGNIAAKDPDDPKALAIGNLCNCSVMLAEDEDDHRDF